MGSQRLGHDWATFTITIYWDNLCRVYGFQIMCLFLSFYLNSTVLENYHLSFEGVCVCVCVCVCVLQPWVLYWTPKWHRKKGRHKFLLPTHGRMLKESELEYKSHPELLYSSPYSWWSNSSLWTSVNYCIHGLFWWWEDMRPCQRADENVFQRGNGRDSWRSQERIHEGFLALEEEERGKWRGGWKWWDL